MFVFDICDSSACLVVWWPFGIAFSEDALRLGNLWPH